MADEFDDLKAAMDAATPAPDPLKKKENVAVAEKTFAEIQGSEEAARHTHQTGPIGAMLNGVTIMFNALTTRAGLTATTALVAVGLIAILPQTQELMAPKQALDGLAQTEFRQNEGIEEPNVGGEASIATEEIALSDDLDSNFADVRTGERSEVDEVASAPILMEEPANEMEVAREAVGQSVRNRAQDLAVTAPTAKLEAKRLIAPADPQVIVPESDTEEFSNAPENKVKVVTEEPVSTFSIDVDTAAYAVVRSSLTAGHMPPQDAVRVEEIINYFPYAYPAPEGLHPFEPTVTVMPTPWNDGTNLVHIGIQGTQPAIEDRPPLNLVFLIDTSGSMQDANKLPLLLQSFRLMLNELDPEDEVSIVTYAGSAGQVLEPTKAAEKTKILSALNQLQAGGSTAGQAGLQQAYQVAESMAGEGEVTRVILAMASSSIVPWTSISARF